MSADPGGALGPARSNTPVPAHWALLRDVGVFQLKLLLDGVRDLLLSPVSLIAAAAGLVFDADRPGRLFHEVLRFGRRTDHWIALFSAAGPEGSPSSPEPGRDVAPSIGVDSLVARVEDLLADEVERGGLTAQAKESIDRVLERVQHSTRRPR